MTECCIEGCTRSSAGSTNKRLRKNAEMCDDHRNATSHYGNPTKMCTCGHDIYSHHTTGYQGYKTRRCASRNPRCQCVAFEAQPLSD